MQYQIIERDTSYLLPLENAMISGLDLSNFLGLELTPEGMRRPMFVLDINLSFELKTAEQKSILQPHDTEAVKRAID